jgi:hypothetical protein
MHSYENNIEVRNKSLVLLKEMRIESTDEIYYNLSGRIKIIKLFKFPTNC